MLNRDTKHRSKNVWHRLLACGLLFTGWKPLLLLCLLIAAPMAIAQNAPLNELPKLPTREIRVPIDDLPVLLGGTNERMFMTRSEYDDLLKKANVTPEQIAIARQQQLDESQIPTGVIMLDAMHTVTIETGRAGIQSDLTIEVLKPGLQTVHLTLQHVGLLEASLDEKPAMLSPTLDAKLAGATLFLTGKGIHRLRLMMVAAVSTSAAQQTLTIALPHAAANKWTMNVPGNVEILSGAHVRSRKVDIAANSTQFEWLPNRAEGARLHAPFSLVMTLNNKMLRDTRALEAKSFIATEITEAYEQVTQRVMINVLNGAENKFQMTIPNGFEVRQVQSPLLSRWNTIAKPQATLGTERVLEVELREPVSDQVVLDIVASKPASGGFSEQPVAWRWPVWQVLDADNQSSILAIRLENGLRMQSLEVGKLIPLDEGVFAAAAIPAELIAHTATAPVVRTVATLYAPDASQSINAQITKPKATSKSAFNVLAIVSDSGVRARALVEFETGNESIANFEVALPESWRLQIAKLSDGVALPFEILNAAGTTRVRLARPFAPRSVNQIVLECSTVPKGWLADWSEQSFAFPAIGIVGAEVGASVLSAMGEGDFALDVAKADNLIALFESERIALKIQGDGSGPSYSAEGDKWSLALVAKRKKPQLTAEVFSFFKIESEGIKNAYELHLEIKQATADFFQFSLPESTPQELTIRGLGNAVVKESTSRIEEGRRIWSIKLASRASGLVKLAIDFSKNLETAVDLVLPIPRVSDTTYQTGLIAIEGDDELEVSVLQHPRVADVGELTESSYSVGNRLLGVYGYSVSDPASDTVSVRATRRELQSVPSTIVERAQLSSALSAHRASYHIAELRLRTTGGFIQAKLPSNAVLWSVIVDGLPSLPQRLDDQLLIELRAHSKNRVSSNSAPSDPNLHVLRIAYETPISAIGMRTDVELVAPLLATMQTAASPSSPIPTADMEWQVWVPDQLKVVESFGDLRLTNDQETIGFPYNISSVLGKFGASTASESFRMKERIVDSRSRSMGSKDRVRNFNSIPLSLAESKSPLYSESSLGDANGDSDPFSGGATPAKPQVDKSVREELFADHFNSIEMATVPLVDSPRGIARDSLPPAIRGGIDARYELSAQTAQDSGFKIRGQAAFANQKSLDGLRTLPIDFEGPSTWHSFHMTGFGDSPSIRLSVVNNQRLNWIAGALAALVVALGLATLGRSIRYVLRWTLGLMAFSIAIALLSPWPIETGILASGCFYGALAVLVVRLLFGFIRSIASVFANPKAVAASLFLLFMISLSSVGSMVQAQDKPVGQAVRSLDELLTFMRLHATTDKGPIEIPADAIVVPYQPNLPALPAGTEKILVPYSTYAQLLNLANPDKATTKPIEPPVEYSLSNLSYDANLKRDDALAFTFAVDITPHTERGILIPFGFQGAILTSAKLNDEPASVSSSPNGLALLVKGKRSQTFTASFQIPIQRQGGWRIINATLPSAPSGKMKLTVPVANTEVRLIGLPDAEQKETTQANEAIETSVAADGKLSLQWRPKVSESVADQGLSVDAECALAVEEQGIHIVWDVKLEFRRGRRDMFDFELPKDLVIERVTGKNIRGWTIDDQAEKQIVKVTLLKSAVESEQLTIVASRPKRLGEGIDMSAVAPKLLMPEAMLQRGKITIYRSSLLELEISKSEGLVREDLRAELAAIGSSSPVPLKVFQAYRYGSTDYQLDLKVREVANKLKSQTESTLRVSRNDSRLQTVVNLASGNRPLFRVRIEVPADWQWDAPQSGLPMEWTLSEPKEGARVFDILFLNGQTGTVPIRLNASQNRTSDLQSNEYTVALPKIRILDATEEQGEIAIFTDVGVDVRPDQLEGCEIAASRAAPSALQQAVQSLVQGNSQAAVATPSLAAPPKSTIRYATGNYKGLLRFQSRVPQVTAMSISNVKVTRRSLEETVYMEWEIKEAGVHRFEFTVPARLKDAVISAQMVRKIERTPTSEQADAPVKCVIELQEDVMGQYRVLVQQDSPLPPGMQPVPIPSILTGTVESRFVTLENSGRDELVVEALKGITQLVRGDSQWVKLQSLLGGKSADVYRVDERPAVTPTTELSANAPSMAFKSQSRSVVETASARIGLANCTLSVDEAGNYRATQEFRIENTSEAYLELGMPAGAKLWTAIVAGAPVKPIQSSNKPTRTGAARLRLPLVRTQTGDLDYGVELKYAGKLKMAGFTTKLEFPLIESININVELSQVKLLLPENLYWYGFDGTLGQVRGQSDFLAGWLLHKNKQIDRLSQLTTKDSELFSKARAEENLKQLESTVKLQLSNSAVDLNANSSLQEQVMQNDFVNSEVKARIAQSESEGRSKAAPDNRSFFNGLLDSQMNYRANGNVDSLGKNGRMAGEGFENADRVSQPASKPGMAPQLAGALPLPQMPPLPQSQMGVETRPSAYLGRAAVQNGKDSKPSGGESKDSKELASRYRSKLQSQSEAKQNAYNLANEPVPSAQSNAPAFLPGGYGGGLGGSMGGEMGGGMGGMGAPGGISSGMQGGMGGAGMGSGGMGVPRNNFGVTPAFGAPDGSMDGRMSALSDVIASTISPNEWQSTGGSSEAREFRQNLALVVTAPQETQQATEQPYMNSLAITLPARGKEFFFTTPRGDAVLSVNGVSKSVTQMLIGLVIFVLGIVVFIRMR